jgi:DNA-binding Xre family transcriptional regulator
MQIRIGELKTRARREGRRLTWEDIEQATGIRQPTLISMNNGTAKQIRPKYLDALCKFFGVGVAELLEPEDVTLPLQLNIRPDRRGEGTSEIRD